MDTYARDHFEREAEDLLIRYDCRGEGPPRTKLGKTTYFRRASYHAWILSLERQPTRDPTNKKVRS
jgi:hypothetical protein